MGATMNRVPMKTCGDVMRACYAIADRLAASGLTGRRGRVGRRASTAAMRALTKAGAEWFDAAKVRSRNPECDGLAIVDGFPVRIHCGRPEGI